MGSSSNRALTADETGNPVGRDYFDCRRTMIDGFVARHFTWPATLRRHGAALGWDILRAPVNVALSPKQFAARVAPMMRIIARVAAPLIWVLDRSGKLVLALLGQSGSQSRGVSDEEVRLIIAEAESTGAMNRAESQMIAGVMRIADRTARCLMTARREVETLDASSDKADLLQRLHDLSRSRLPVWEGDVDAIVSTTSIPNSAPDSLGSTVNPVAR